MARTCGFTTGCDVVAPAPPKLGVGEFVISATETDDGGTAITERLELKSEGGHRGAILEPGSAGGQSRPLLRRPGTSRISIVECTS